MKTRIINEMKQHFCKLGGNDGDDYQSQDSSEDLNNNMINHIIQSYQSLYGK